ncbi:unnamed protein product [Haemonchus placei]|uniref:MFS domain-containing protein n=1 Tax=Haemonchus placei TaxID=6290 RepID=A0A3P7VIG8_HAEPC|nr:unnamed protein product [Haemonchus placei]
MLGFLWCIVWHFTVNNSPANSKWISDHEVKYLQHHLPKKHVKTEKKVIPWHAMARSAPLLVVFYSSIIGNMMIAMILVYIPVYFKDVLLLEVKQNGLYTMLPHVFNLISKLVWGFLMDYLKSKKILTATQTVKLSQVLSMMTLCLCFLGLAYGVDCSTHGLALFLLCTIGAAFGLSISGFLTSLLSLSPNFIGVLTSTSQVIGFGGRLAAPQIITFFKTVGTAEEWRGILLVYSAMTVISALLVSIDYRFDQRILSHCTPIAATPNHLVRKLNKSNEEDLLLYTALQSTYYRC